MKKVFFSPRATRRLASMAIRIKARYSSYTGSWFREISAPAIFFASRLKSLIERSCVRWRESWSVKIFRNEFPANNSERVAPFVSNPAQRGNRFCLARSGMASVRLRGDETRAPVWGIPKFNSANADKTNLDWLLGLTKLANEVTVVTLCVSRPDDFIRSDLEKASTRFSAAQDPWEHKLKDSSPLQLARASFSCAVFPVSWKAAGSCPACSAARDTDK